MSRKYSLSESLHFAAIVIGVAALVLVVFYLIQNPPIRAGEVIEKTYHEEYSYVQIVTVPHTVTDGKTTTTYYTYIPIYHHVPEQWSVSIRGKDKKGRTKERTVYVSMETYDSLGVGDWYEVEAGDGEELLVEKRDATESEQQQFGTAIPTTEGD